MTFFFDTQAAVAKIQNRRVAPATSATPATQEVQNGPHVAEVAKVAAPFGQIAKNGTGRNPPTTQPQPPQQRPPNPGPVPDRVGVGGRPRTWTGKVVSLDEWRRLSEWERHGPGGKVWNGKTQHWEKPNG